MKKIIKKAHENNTPFWAVYCASDPNSLDGVILPQKKTVIMDGTAPHIVEPMLPGVGDCILDFGRFWNDKILKAKATEILDLTRENKGLHKSAARFISAVGKIAEELLVADFDNDTAEKYAEIIKQFIPQKGGKGGMWNAFICGVSPRGVLSFADHITAEHKFALRDENGGASQQVFSLIKDAAIKKGYEIINFKNPILPSSLTDGIYIPELSLLVLREYLFLKPNASFKALDLCTPKADFEKEKQVLASLIEMASEKIFKAKEVHDRLEEDYICAMDFDALGEYCEDFLDKI
jgi:hypothetical protein